MAKANHIFAEVCEAYEVLNDRNIYLFIFRIIYLMCFLIATLRKIYDQYGEEILKCGLPDINGGKMRNIILRLILIIIIHIDIVVQGGYRFNGNTNEIFE